MNSKLHKYLIDTNVFLRFFTPKESAPKLRQQQQACARLFRKLQQGKIKGLICSVVLMEIYYALKSFYDFDQERCQSVLRTILSQDSFASADQYQHMMAFDLFAQTKVKFTDCLIASLKYLQQGGTLISYDRDFDQLGVKRVEPGQI